MKRRNALVCLILTLALVLGLCPLTGASADTLTAVVDNTSTYGPSKIVNGNFETRPFMTYVYNGTTYTTWPGKSFSGNNQEITSSTPNGVDKGWNTTETKIIDGNLFEYSNSAGTYGVGSANGYFIEMNAHVNATVYQDVSTTGGDVMRWTLRHGFRNISGQQKMKVIIGAPNATGSVTSTDPNITAASKGLFESTGVTNPSGATYAYAGNLANLDLASGSSGWYDCSGIYVIPEGQTVTRFAFEADLPTDGGGNLLDDITFSTLIGNLNVANTGSSVIVKGYWGDTDSSKRLVIEIDGVKNYVDMSSVQGENFTVTIPVTSLATGTVEVYHEDYESAKRTVEVVSAIYVSATGSDDTGNGSLDKPYASLSRAYQDVKSSAKDNLVIALLSDITMTNDTRLIVDSTKSFTITSAKADGTLVENAAGNYDNVYTVHRGDTTYSMIYQTYGNVTVEQVKFDGGNKTFAYSADGSEQGGYLLCLDTVNKASFTMGTNAVFQNNRNDGSGGHSLGGAVVVGNHALAESEHTDNVSFSMESNAEITNCIAPRHGGAITGYNGNIILKDNAKIYKNAIDFTAITSKYYGGGAILVHRSSHLYLSDNAQISDNYVNMNNYGTSYLNNVNTSKSSAVQASQSGKIYVSGDVKIFNNTVKNCKNAFDLEDNEESNLYDATTSGGAIIVEGAMGSSAKIGVRSANNVVANGTTSYTVTSSDAEAFFDDTGANSVVKSSNQLVFGSTITNVKLTLTGDNANKVFAATEDTVISGLKAADITVFVDGSKVTGGYTISIDETSKKFTVTFDTALDGHTSMGVSVSKNGYKVTDQGSGTGSTVITCEVATPPTVELGTPVEDVANRSFSYSNATVTGTVNQVTVTVDSGSFTCDGYTPDRTDLTGLSKTYKVADAAEAQKLLRNCVFTVASDKTAQSVTATVSGDKTDLSTATKGITITQKEIGGVMHYYGYVKVASENKYGLSDGTTFANAYAAAKKLYYNGLQGYLVTITSAEEDAILDNITTWYGSAGASRVDLSYAKQNADYFTTNGQAGGTIIGASGNYNWYWVCGPEAGTEIYTFNTSSVSGYSNWNASEPNSKNSSTGEYVMMVHFDTGLKWNDVNNTLTQPGFFVEWSEDTRVGKALTATDDASHTLTDGYVIKFMPNGKNNTVDGKEFTGKNVTVVKGDKTCMAEFPVISREGYVQIGWTAASGGSIPNYTSEQLIDLADVTGFTYIYPVWGIQVGLPIYVSLTDDSDLPDDSSRKYSFTVDKLTAGAPLPTNTTIDLAAPTAVGIDNKVGYSPDDTDNPWRMTFQKGTYMYYITQTSVSQEGETLDLGRWVLEVEVLPELAESGETEPPLYRIKWAEYDGAVDDLSEESFDVIKKGSSNAKVSVSGGKTNVMLGGNTVVKDGSFNIAVVRGKFEIDFTRDFQAVGSLLPPPSTIPDGTCVGFMPSSAALTGSELGDGGLLGYMGNTKFANSIVLDFDPYKNGSAYGDPDYIHFTLTTTNSSGYPVAVKHEDVSSKWPTTACQYVITNDADAKTLTFKVTLNDNSVLTYTYNNPTTLFGSNIAYFFMSGVVRNGPANGYGLGAVGTTAPSLTMNFDSFYYLGSRTPFDPNSCVFKNKIAYVASTGSGASLKKWGSVQNAVNAATTSADITMLRDSTENVTIPSGKNISLELAGHSINAEYSSEPVITNEGTLTLTNDSATNVNITGGSYGVKQSGTMTLGGNVSITGNTDANLYLASGKVVEISKTLPLTEDASIGVKLESTIGMVTGSNSTNYSGNFTSDNTSYNVFNTGSGDDQAVAILGSMDDFAAYVVPYDDTARQTTGTINYRKNGTTSTNLPINGYMFVVDGETRYYYFTVDEAILAAKAGSTSIDGYATKTGETYDNKVIVEGTEDGTYAGNDYLNPDLGDYTDTVVLLKDYGKLFNTGDGPSGSGYGIAKGIIVDLNGHNVTELSAGQIPSGQTLVITNSSDTAATVLGYGSSDRDLFDDEGGTGSCSGPVVFSGISLSNASGSGRNNNLWSSKHELIFLDGLYSYPTFRDEGLQHTSMYSGYYTKDPATFGVNIDFGTAHVEAKAGASSTVVAEFNAAGSHFTHRIVKGTTKYNVQLNINTTDAVLNPDRTAAYTGETLEKEYGTDITLITGLVREGYTMLGWARTADATAGNYTDTLSVELTKDASGNTIEEVLPASPVVHGSTVNLYAVWGKNVVSVPGKHEGGIYDPDTDTTSYPSVQDAIDNSKPGDKLDLIGDVEENITVPADKDLIIDLKGHELTAEDEDKIVLTNYGDLTLIDSVGGGNVTGGAGGVMQNGTLEVGGKLEISGNTQGDLCIPTGKKVNISDEYPPEEGMSVGVYTQSLPDEGEFVTLSDDNDQDYSEYFFADTTPYVIVSGEDNKLKLHLHSTVENYVYSADGANLTASCKGADECDMTATLTLVPPESPILYDSDPKPATLSDTGSMTWTDIGLTTPTIYYEGADTTVYAKTTTAPTEVGVYKATITAGGKTAELTYTVLSREIILTSTSASKTYDGLPLTKAEVRVTEGTFLPGDGFTYVCTGSMTEVGCASNEFTYTLNETAAKRGYVITCEFGTLTVEPVPGKNLQPDTDDLREETEKLIEENPGSTVSVWMVINRDVPNKDKLALQYKTSGKQSIFYQANIYAKIDGVTYDIGDTNETVIGVTSKFYLAGRKDIHVYRLHNGTDVDELTETPNANGEYVIFDTANDQIIVKAMKYSTFCFVWKGEPPRTGDNTNLWLYVGMAAVSVLGVATVVVSKKKRRG